MSSIESLFPLLVALIRTASFTIYFYSYLLFLQPTLSFALEGSSSYITAHRHRSSTSSDGACGFLCKGIEDRKRRKKRERESVCVVFFAWGYQIFCWGTLPSLTSPVDRSLKVVVVLHRKMKLTAARPFLFRCSSSFLDCSTISGKSCWAGFLSFTTNTFLQVSDFLIRVLEEEKDRCSDLFQPRKKKKKHFYNRLGFFYFWFLLSDLEW